MQRREQAQHFSHDKITCVRSACATIYKAQGRRRDKHRDQRERCAGPNMREMGRCKQGRPITRLGLPAQASKQVRQRTQPCQTRKPVHSQARAKQPCEGRVFERTLPRKNLALLTINYTYYLYIVPNCTQKQP